MFAFPRAIALFGWSLLLVVVDAMVMWLSLIISAFNELADPSRPLRLFMLLKDAVTTTKHFNGLSPSSDEILLLERVMLVRFESKEKGEQSRKQFVDTSSFRSFLNIRSCEGRELACFFLRSNVVISSGVVSSGTK